MSELSDYIKLVFYQQHLVDLAEEKTVELDAQDQLDQEKFIVSLG